MASFETPYTISEFMDTNMLRSLVDSITDTIPSTRIRLTMDDIERLENLVVLPKKENGNYYVPSDIIEANIVPIKSLAIEMDLRPLKEEVVRFDTYVVDRSIYGEDAAMAMISYTKTGTRHRVHLINVKDGQLVYAVAPGNDPELAEQIWNQTFTFSEIWYYIQVSLLHPTLKEVFRRSGIMGDKEREESKDYKKRPLFYQKVKTINIREFDEAVKRSINRKALIWYVIGHWRTYKDGRRIFIQPYWKGALRETKATDTPRERVI